MARGASSRVFHEPFGRDGRDREIFPLPQFDISAPCQQSLSRRTRRRILTRKAIAERSNMAISALNSLYFGSDHWDKKAFYDLAALPLGQSDCLKNILSRVRQLGAPPEDACCQGALQALRTAGNSYDEPDPGVGSVVDMRMDRLSLPSGKVAGVSLADHLTGAVKNMVCDYEGHMLQDASVWTDLEEVASKLKPYDDPILNTHEGYLSFLSHLFKCGILGFTASCRGRVGAFCVSKKPKDVNGVLHERQRLVLDCRAVNLLFKEPPRTRLGSLSSVSEMYLETDQKLYVATADICDCFYACDVPKGMEQFFCLKSDISLSDALQVTGGSYDLSVFTGMDFITPCITVLPMGFNWSFYLVQVLHEQAALSALGIPEDKLFLDGSPPPVVSDGYCCTMPYCDNVHVLSYSPTLCQKGKDLVASKLEGMGFVLHEHTEAATVTHTLGGIIDGERGLVSCTPKRIWSLIWAFEYLACHRVSTELVQRLLGHAMVACVINRGGMCVFRKLYDFVQSGCRPRRLNSEERRECLIFSGILPLLVADLRRPWTTTVTATDASPEGWGVCEREADLQQVQAIGKWQERWRFRRLDPSEWKPRERAVGGNPFTDAHTVKGSLDMVDELDQYTVNVGFPEVPQSFLDKDCWSTVSMGRWKHHTEHITLKEGRALVLALRRLSRAQRHRGRRHLVLLDNMALCFAVNKGRSHNFGLLRILQQIGSIGLASSISVRARWIASETNIADGPSRGQLGPGPYCKKEPSQDSANKYSKSLGKTGKCEHSTVASPAQGNSFSAGQKDPQEGLAKSRDSQSNSESPTAKNEEDNSPVGSSTGSGSSSWEESKVQPTDQTRADEHQFRGPASVRNVLQQVSGLLYGERRGGAKRCHDNGRHVSRLHGCLFSGQAHSSRRRKDNGRCGVQALGLQRKTDEEQASYEGLEESHAKPKQAAVAEGRRLWHSNAAGSQGAERNGPEGCDRFHPVPSTGGRRQPHRAMRSGSSQISWRAVQVGHSGGARFRGSSSRQSGGVRQQHSCRSARRCLDRRTAAEKGKEFEGQGPSLVHLHCGRVPQSFHPGWFRSRSAKFAPVSVETRGGNARPYQQRSSIQRSEGSRKMVDRQQRAPLHKGGARATTAEQVNQEQPELLSMGREEPQASVARDEAAKDGSRFLRFPDIFTMQNRPRRFCLEIFAGTARVSQCVLQRGINMFPIDTCLFPFSQCFGSSNCKGYLQLHSHTSCNVGLVGYALHYIFESSKK